MKRLPIYLSLLLLLSCAKEDSHTPNTPPSDITKQYSLTVSAGDGGSVSTAGGTFSQGTQVSITATPNAGYSFSSWSNGSTANPLTVTLNSNTSVTANFEAIVNNYTLTVSAGEGGSVSSEGGEYEEGTEVTITATPDEGYKFIGWEGIDNNSDSISITINSDISLQANFIELCEIDYTSLFFDINKLTSHYQPYTIPFIDYAEQLGISLSYGLFGIYANNGDFNSNQVSDYVMVTNNGDNPSDNEVIIVLDNGNYFRFESPQVGTRKISVSDLNQDGYDDIVLFGHGIDTGNSPGDKTHVIYMYDSSYEVVEVGIISGFYHTGVVGVLEGSFPDILDIDSQAAFTIGANSKIKYYLNSGTAEQWEQKETNIPNYWVSRTYQSELFDIDNDGILDLILGGHEWSEAWMSSSQTPPQWRTHILKGLGNGNFDLDNPIFLPIIPNWGVITDIDVYDINNDSEFEIIITRTTGKEMEMYQPTSETYYDGHMIQILKFSNNEWYNWQIVEQPSELFSDNQIGNEWPYVTKIYDVNKDCLLDIIPESDKLNAKSFEPLNNIRGLYYEQQTDGTFEIKYFDN